MTRRRFLRLALVGGAGLSGAARIETLVYRVVPDRNTRVTMLETGQADLVSGITPEDFPILDRLPNVNKVAVESTYRMHVGIPTDVPRYRDKRINWVPIGYSQLHPWLPDEEDVRIAE